MTPTLWKITAICYALASLITFIAYGWDKRRAANGGWRTPEARLHWMEFFCGWPGGLAGQAVFRHKRRKTRYMVVFWGIVAVHAAAWVAVWKWA